MSGQAVSGRNYPYKLGTVLMMYGGVISSGPESPCPESPSGQRPSLAYINFRFVKCPLFSGYERPIRNIQGLGLSTDISLTEYRLDVASTP
jgi:hypothetical protein